MQKNSLSALRLGAISLAALMGARLLAWAPPTNPDYATSFGKATVWDVHTAMTNSGRVGRGNPNSTPPTTMSELADVSLRALQLYRYDPARIMSAQTALGLSDFASTTAFLDYVASFVQQQIQVCDQPYTVTNTTCGTSSTTTPLKADTFVTGPFGRSVFLLKLLRPSALSAVNPSAPTVGETFEGTFVRRLAADMVPYMSQLQSRGALGYGNRELSTSLGNFVLYRMYGDGSSGLAGLGLSATDLASTQNLLAQNATMVESYWNGLMAYVEPDENSSNYTRIGLNAIVSMADILGKTDADPVTNPNVAALPDSFYVTVAKNAELISPAGYLPIFGDSYFKSEFLQDPPFAPAGYDPEQVPLGYYVNHTTTSTIYLFERVGRLAALNGISAISPSDLLGRARKLWTQTKVWNASKVVLPEWIMTGNATATDPVSASSLIVSRPPVVGTAVDRLAKLVLRPSSEPNSPMLMMDLISGDHSHPSVRGGISWFEVQQSPLFYNYGRYLQGDYFANQVVLRKTTGTDMFPLTTSTSSSVSVADLPISDGQWHTQTVNMADFAWQKTTPDTSTIVHIDQLSLAVTSSSTDYADFKLDNIRLVSRDGTSVVLVNACDTTTNWTGGDLSIDTADKTEGTGSLRFGLNSPCVGYSLRKVAALFPNGIDLSQYCYLRFDYKAEVATGSHLPCYRIQCRWYGGPGKDDTAQAALAAGVTQAHRAYDTWQYITPHPVFDLNEDPANTFVGENTTQRFSYGRVSWDHYGTWDHALKRNLLLTSEGVLVIVDEISSLNPEGGATSWMAGSLWQIYTPGVSGTDWFSNPWEVPYPDLNATSSPWTQGRGFVVKFGTNGGAASTHLVSVPNIQLTNDDALRRGYATNTVNHNLNIALVQQPMTTGTITLVTVVAPAPRGEQNPYIQSIGNGITITNSPATGVTVTVAAYPTTTAGAPGIVDQNLTVTRSTTGTWSVTRSP